MCSATCEENLQLQYLSGFGNHLSSESEKCPGALPKKQYHPQKCPFGLYNEILSGSSFTSPRKQSYKSSLYRIRPSVCHLPFETDQSLSPFFTNDFDNKTSPNQLSWLPFDFPEEGKQADFIESLKTLCGKGDPSMRYGLAIHIYTCNVSMVDKSFYNSDGDMLIVPQLGTLFIYTEFGKMTITATEFAVIPQGIKFSVSVKGPNRGYILELFGNHFELPELGPIGTVGLADPRHFLSPVAWFEDRDIQGYKIINKFQGRCYVAKQDFSPFDVVAWHGNYLPYKYDLNNFIALNSVTFDHIDPSIFTVLTCPSLKPGSALADFVVFPPRWIVQENTFRPAYYHRNCMAEFMGLIFGEVSGEHGLKPGGASLHGIMTPHGPDQADFQKGISSNLLPVRVSHYMSFMFETSLNLSVTDWASTLCQKLDPEYFKIWQNLKKNFNPHWKPEEIETNEK